MKILNLGNRVVNQYLVELNDGFLLIDTGYSNGYKRFIKNLSKQRDNRYVIEIVQCVQSDDFGDNRATEQAEHSCNERENAESAANRHRAFTSVKTARRQEAKPR